MAGRLRGGTARAPSRWNANGTVTRLAPLAGSHATALDIDNSGTVVGYSHLSGSRFHATAWRNAG